MTCGGEEKWRESRAFDELLAGGRCKSLKVEIAIKVSVSRGVFFKV